MVLLEKLLVSASFVAAVGGVLFVGGMLVNGAISAVAGRAANGSMVRAGRRSSVQPGDRLL